jgi:N-acetyl-anhydromuramyl-L-alanine amidase AmpD
MSERWVNVQPNGGILPGDNLSAFDGALAILDWQEPCTKGLTLLNIPVKCWRWTQNPVTWQGWPDNYVKQCPLAMFANEPDIEGFPPYYDDVCDRWVRAGGKLVAPAYSDEAKRAADERIGGIIYDYYTWHAYAGNFTNRDKLLARQFDKPIIGTEYGVAHNQNKCVSDLLQIPEPVAIFVWRWAGNSAAGYDVSSMGLEFVKGGNVASAPKMTWIPSPNYWRGRNGKDVSGIVYHGTAGPNAAQWFANLASQVSAHFVISKDGSIAQCVDIDNSAWHAGVVTGNSIFTGKPNPNYWTIGIEHERDTTNTSPLTDGQIAASKALTRWLRSLYPKAVPILHDAIDVGRVCPGPNFPLDAIWNNGKATVPVDLNSQTIPAIQPEPKENITSDNDASNSAAQAYYFQHGYKVDTTHAIWTECLLPLYVEWQKLVASKSPLADACCPGPLVSNEAGTTWGVDTKAGFVKTENSAYGVRESGGAWLPYRLRVY